MNDWSLPNAVSAPLTIPIPRPSTSVSRSASSGLPLSAKMASAAAVSPTIEPTERSMLPVVITKVIATATMTVGAT